MRVNRNGRGMMGSFLLALGFPLGAKGINSNSLVLKLLSGVLMLCGITFMFRIESKEERVRSSNQKVIE